jgi:hypothetical protein
MSFQFLRVKTNEKEFAFSPFLKWGEGGRSFAMKIPVKIT